MSVKRVVNLPNVNGWAGTAAGAFSAHTISVDIPVGPRYHAIWIAGNAGAAKASTDLFNEIRVKVNGKAQRTITLQNLLKLNALYGSSFVGISGNVVATNFYIPIWFAEPWRKSVAAQDGLAWGTGDLSSFQLELDVQAYAGAAAGLIQPTFKAEVDNALVSIDGRFVDQPMGAITKWFNVQYPIQAVSTYHDFTGLPKREFYAAIHATEDNIDEFEVKVDNSVIRQDTQEGNEAKLKGREMDPVAASTTHAPARDWVDIVFDHDDLLNSALPMEFNGRKVQDFNLRLKSGAAGAAPRNINILYEMIGLPE